MPHEQVIARIVDGSELDEFKAMYGETLVTGTPVSHSWHTVRARTSVFPFQRNI